MKIIIRSAKIIDPQSQHHNTEKDICVENGVISKISASGTIIDKVDQELGYPETDPHGSPIPSFHKKEIIRLSNLLIGQKAIVYDRLQKSMSILESYQLTIGTLFEVISMDDNSIEIKIGIMKKKIPIEEAHKIHIKITDNLNINT